jgi:hypothetical protein
MPAARLFLPILAVLGACLLGGCGTLGSTAIRLERGNNNQAIHQTSREQLLLNLVRLHHHELPSFLSVESITGGSHVTVNASTPGLRFPFPMAGPYAGIAGGDYSEGPNITYHPLQGAELVAQLNSPISVKSLVDMHYSGWTLTPLMALIVTRLAEGHQHHEDAKNAMRALSGVEALILEAAQSSQLGDVPKINQSDAAERITSANVLALYFSTKGEFKGDLKCAPNLKSALGVERFSVTQWLHLLKIYRPQETRGVTEASIASASPAELNRIISKLPNTIEINATSGRSRGGQRKAPILRTRSALGVMKNLAEQLTKFVSPEEASQIIDRHEQAACASKDYYTTEEDQRYYLLVQVSDFPPLGAFVTAYENGKYYFIADDISKRTMALLALITNVQAIPTPSTSPLPVILVNR